MMSIGWIIRRAKIVTLDFLDEMNRFCSGILIPVLMFHNTYTTDLKQAFNVPLLAFSIVSVVLLCAAGHFLSPLVEKDPGRRGILTLSVFRSNYIIFGMVIAKNICGDENLGPITMLAAIIVPVMNFLCIVVLGASGSGELKIKNQAANLVKNPMLIAVAAGFTLQSLPFRLPPQLQEAIRDISRCAAPLSLVILGGIFKVSAIKKNIGGLVFGLTGKLVAAPAIMLPLAVLCGFRGPSLIALISLYIAPVAINVFNFAKSMDADVELAGQYVVLSSLLSVGTIFFWIFLLSALRLI
jgi:predicted permease